MRTPPLPETPPRPAPARGATPPASLVEGLQAAVGAAHVLTDPDVVSSYTTDWTRRFSGPASLVVRPASTEEVAQVLRACLAARTPVVVQGGNTGLVGASVPPRSAGPVLPVVLSTTRLAAIGPVDTAAAQVTAGAGATLAAVQQVARSAGLDLPVDLAARDSATIGGMVGTNAGGVHVLRYGAMRRQVLGTEAVLADGRVLSHLGGLVKDNTGYDLSQLLVGSEGTLAVVTAVRLRLVPRHPARAVAVLGVGSTAEAVRLVGELRRHADGLSAAEIFYQEGLDLVCRHAGVEAPFPAPRPAYLLVEATGREEVADQLISVLAEAGVDDEATAIADDEAGALRLWVYRERLPEAVSSIGVPHKMDVTLPLGELADFEPAVRRAVDEAWPGATVVLWGHVGDGNVHVNVVGPPPDDETVDRVVLELAASRGGSISAEHGIGRAKAALLGLSRSPAEVATMQAVKDALDPEGILNPGVLFAPAHAPAHASEVGIGTARGEGAESS